MLCPLIILRKRPIVIGCPMEAKLWLVSKAVSKGTANDSLQCSLASKQSHDSTNIHEVHMHSRTKRIALIAELSSIDISKHNDGNPTGAYTLKTLCNFLYHDILEIISLAHQIIRQNQ